MSIPSEPSPARARDRIASEFSREPTAEQRVLSERETLKNYCLAKIDVRNDPFFVEKVTKIQNMTLDQFLQIKALLRTFQAQNISYNAASVVAAGAGALPLSDVLAMSSLPPPGYVADEKIMSGILSILATTPVETAPTVPLLPNRPGNTTSRSR